MIDSQILGALRDCSRLSFENTPFPEVVRKLIGVGIESYHADLLRLEKTYYLPTGDSHVEPEEPRYAAQLPASLVSPEFDADAVQRAVRRIQKAEIGYLEFLQEIMRAGVSSYYVYIRGRRVIYSGRTGDEQIEWFPGTK
jgi:uncharacterized protein YbcV (DUF1398 family)